MSNPIDDFLEMDKQGGLWTGVTNQFSSAGREALGGKLVGGALIAGGTMAVTGLGAAASKIYEAVDKRRGFKEMMSLDPGLKDLQAEKGPKLFNAAYSSLRNVNPTYGKDPLIAGAFMRRIMENPETAGLQIAATLQAPKAPMSGQYAFKPESLHSQGDSQKAEMDQYGLAAARRGAELAPGEHALKGYEQKQKLDTMNRQKSFPFG